MPWEEFVDRLPAVQADPGLAEELHDILPDTTEDL
jgi:hypothetical protein